ncbi:MAG: ATP-dependent DNA helicase [Gemmatimonadota bacterium]|nr:ATP-dependent DNA helicase [Gemmatimonadota bacterium]
MSNQPTIEQARSALQSHFGYPAFRPGQENAVLSVLSGRDTLVILPTGGGKSLCFQVPALILPGLTVVVSPLISLMKDQVDALRARGLPAAFINSTLSGNEVADRMARAQSGELKMLYVAPERFDAGSTAERLRAIGVSLLAVDEAHCISEWGHDFRPSYLRVGRVRELLGSPPTIALTATATPEVRNDIARQLSLRAPKVIITGFDRKNLHYHVVPVRSDSDKDDSLAESLRKYQGLAIVYASTRKAVERIAADLSRAGLPAEAYHAGLDDVRRHEVQDAFMRGQVRAIVATNAFGMGIDKANVRLVVHYAMPGTLEAYYQEAGRAGRDGQHSDCVLLHAFQDRFTHEYFIKGAYPSRATVEAVYTALKRFADTTGSVAATVNEIAVEIGGAESEREIESALRVLTTAGAVKNEPASSSRFFVRLLATPDRIKRDLSGAADAAERDLLRCLWRAVGAAIYTGAVIDPMGLPPGFGGPPGVSAMLQTLQNRQFVMWERTGGGLRLTDVSAALSAIKVDWSSLGRRRRADLAKLDAVQRYAYATGCRRGFVLRYFGDPAAKNTCEGCDNCLGTHKKRDAGSGRTKVPKLGKLPNPKRQRSGTPAESSEAQPALSGRDVLLLATLKELRGTIAREDKVPAYVVFADRTLTDLAASRPGTLMAMQTVRGIGPAKLEKYGARFLAEIQRAATRETA